MLHIKEKYITKGGFRNIEFYFSLRHRNLEDVVKTVRFWSPQDSRSFHLSVLPPHLWLLSWRSVHRPNWLPRFIPFWSQSRNQLSQHFFFQQHFQKAHTTHLLVIAQNYLKMISALDEYVITPNKIWTVPLRKEWKYIGSEQAVFSTQFWGKGEKGRGGVGGERVGNRK